MKDYYKILRVDKNASQDVIKKAYKKLSLKWHPDKHASDTKEKQKEADEKFKEINEAYETLGNPEKRQQYDNPQSSIFDSFFRQERTVPRGSDIIVNINLNLKDFYEQKPKTFKYKYGKRCIHCGGAGGDYKVCDKCHGSGYTMKIQQTPVGIFQQSETCMNCHGTGRIYTSTCKHCNGSGYETENKKYTINISDINPESLPMNIVLEQYGGNESKEANGYNGRLIGRFYLDISDKYRIVNGNVYELTDIPYYDIILGTDKDVILPNGNQITLHIPKDSKNGDMIISKGNGIKGKDYYMCIKMVIPKTNENDYELLEKIKENHKS